MFSGYKATTKPNGSKSLWPSALRLAHLTYFEYSLAVSWALQDGSLPEGKRQVRLETKRYSLRRLQDS